MHTLLCGLGFFIFMSKIEYHRLPSGLRLVYYPIESNVTYMGYSVQVGAASDPHNYHGLAHCTEHMLFKGTTLRGAAQLVDRVESVGADINAFTTKDDTTIHVATPTEYALRVLHVLTDVVVNSNIPAEELAKEKEVIIEEIGGYLDTPSERIFDEFEEILFRGTSLSHNILGSESSVRRISSSVVRRFMDQYYRPDNMVLGIWGRVDLNRVIDIVEHIFDRRRPYPRTPFRREGQHVGACSSLRRSSISHRYGTNQCHCIIGTKAPSLHTRERYALSLFNNFLGGPAISSKLNQLLREDLGLVYSVESNYTPYHRDGIWTVYLGTGRDTLQQAIDAVHRVVDRYIAQPLSAQELEKTKVQLHGQLLLSNDQHEGQLLSMLKSYLFFDTYNTIEDLFATIRSITAEEVWHTAQQYLLPERRITLTYR